MELFLICVFQRNYVDTLDRTGLFLDQKIKVLKRAKKRTFCKRVSPWILSKNRTFPYWSLSQKSYQKRSLLILWKEKNDFKIKKLNFKKGQKLDIFQRGQSMDFVQKSNFLLSLFFHRNYVRKDRFSIFWIPKKSFLDQTIEFLTRAKKWTFFKGVSPWIMFKNRAFSYSCFSQKSCQKRSFFNILERKQSFLDQKTRAKK